MKKFLIRFLITGFFSGYSPVAPGTAGSVVGVLIFLFAGKNIYLLLSVTAVFTVLGFLLSGYGEIYWNEVDSPKIVIDEISGFLIANILNRSPLVGGDWKILILSFFIFRFFDIAKPFPINRSQKLPGGVGVMMDDIIAGIYTLAVLKLGLFIKSIL